MANQKLKIASLTSRKANTRFGEKEQWVVNAKWTAFIGNWNKNWKIGDYAEGIFKENKVGDKTYYNIECPPELRQQGGGMSTQILQQILQELVIIRTIAQANSNAVVYEPETESTKPIGQSTAEPEPSEPEPGELSTGEPEINVDDIPF